MATLGYVAMHDWYHDWKTDIGLRLNTPFSYPAEGADAVAYHKTAAALSDFSKTGLTDILDIAPYIRFIVSQGWWTTGLNCPGIAGGHSVKIMGPWVCRPAWHNSAPLLRRAGYCRWARASAGCCLHVVSPLGKRCLH